MATHRKTPEEQLTILGRLAHALEAKAAGRKDIDTATRALRTAEAALSTANETYTLALAELEQALIDGEVDPVAPVDPAPAHEPREPVPTPPPARGFNPFRR